MSEILSKIKKPGDVSRLGLSELAKLAAEIREIIITVVSRNGGHLAPSLGVVELTLALLKVFDPDRDGIVWDVGHQAYAYKLLTGRFERFDTLRRLGGISGFPRPSESKYDHFGVGHSSTSISAAAGMSAARDLSGRRNAVIAVIGDGSMTAGLAFEGLNQAGEMDRDLIVILNDNEMSISRNVGALSAFLSKQLSSEWALRLKRETETLLKHIPRIGNDLAKYAKRSEEAFKSFFTPGMLFEAFKFNYLGPFDGHNLEGLIDVLGQVRKLRGPVLLHVNTIKGKGYLPAQQNPTHFHGVGRFEPETGEPESPDAPDTLTYTEVFGQTLVELAEKDEHIVAITAAMPEGTGLTAFAGRFPKRFFDVGICEQHAVTFAAGLAIKGFRPFVAIYSTFLQRSYDQIVHDVCLQNLPVVFCLDRAGLVGEDGPTHHGAFDISYLRHIPNMTVMAPKDENELRDMLASATAISGPVAIRYPRGTGIGCRMKDGFETIYPGRGEFLLQGDKLGVIALGSRVHPALSAIRELMDEMPDFSPSLLNARFVKPLPIVQIDEIAGKSRKILTLEENVLNGGFGSAVLEYLADTGRTAGLKIRRLGLPDAFVEHGSQKLLRAGIGLDKQGIKKAILDLWES